MGLKIQEHEQLLNYISEGTEEALQSNSRTSMREWLEEVSDLTDSDNALIFNEDGSVEVETGDQGDEPDEEE